MDIKSSLSRDIPLINMVPLVDLLFFILAFSLLAQAFSPLGGLMISVPKEKRSEEKSLFSAIPLIINEHQTLFLGSNKRITTISSLQNDLEEEQVLEQLQGRGNLHLNLMIDRRVPYEFVVKILSLLQGAPLSIHLSFADGAS